MRLYLKSKRIPRRVGPCVRVRMYIWACMYTCMYMYVYDVAPHGHLCMDVCTCMRMTLRLKCKRVPPFSAMYECMYICVFVSLCVRMSAFLFQVCTCMCACICMYACEPVNGILLPPNSRSAPKDIERLNNMNVSAYEYNVCACTFLCDCTCACEWQVPPVSMPSKCCLTTIFFFLSVVLQKKWQCKLWRKAIAFGVGTGEIQHLFCFHRKSFKFKSTNSKW